MRTNRLPEAWIAPPAIRDLREQVRYRAKLVGLRTGLKAQVHAVFAKAGLQVNHSHPFDTAAGKNVVTYLVETKLTGAFAGRAPLAARVDRNPRRGSRCAQHRAG
jgi:hypothetical protein